MHSVTDRLQTGHRRTDDMMMPISDHICLAVRSGKIEDTQAET